MEKIVKKFSIQKIRHNESDIHIFYDENGMLVGNATGDLVRFGEDTQRAVMRGFMTPQHAIEGVKRMCRETYGKDCEIEFELVDAEKRVIIADPGVMSRLAQ